MRALLSVPLSAIALKLVHCHRNWVFGVAKDCGNSAPNGSAIRFAVAATNANAPPPI
jgi:hypothetical protein